MRQLIKLRGVEGVFQGTPVSEIKVGDMLCMHYRRIRYVVGLEPSKTGKMIQVILLDRGNGRNSVQYVKKMNAKTLVHVVE